MFQEAFPILTVGSIDASLAFYRDGLEFTEDYRFPDQGEPVYVGLQLGASHLGIGLDPKVQSGERATPGANGSFDLWVYADDCDAAVKTLRSSGVEIVEEPTDQPWGERLARVVDPDGNGVIVATRKR